MHLRDVVDWPGYRVSDDGRVWSCWGRGRHAPTDTWRPLKLILDRRENYGYFYVNLCRTVNGVRERKHRFTHALVLEAFVGPRPKGFDGCHGNGVRTDNRLANLRWGTRKENQEDMVRHGKSARGTKQHMNKLSEKEVRVIRRLVKQGVSQRTAAKRYGVHFGTVSDIITGKNWAWLS